jgi:hypothetical protein
MKTYPYTHSRAIALPHNSLLWKSIFLLISTLITVFAFAGGGGGNNSGSGNGADEASQFSLPLVLKTFKASVNNKKINLDWVTGHEKDLTHFVIERSTNGKDYTQVGIVFALGNSTAVQNYNYPDAINTTTKGVVYYRLKLMDSRQRHQYSPVKLVRINDGAAEMQVLAYPNPVVNELRITVPSAWQSKQVSYEVYNMNGSMVKRITSANASQTEILNVKDLGTGTYVVKAYTQTETLSQRIVKK